MHTQRKSSPTVNLKLVGILSGWDFVLHSLFIHWLVVHWVELLGASATTSTLTWQMSNKVGRDATSVNLTKIGVSGASCMYSRNIFLKSILGSKIFAKLTACDIKILDSLLSL